MTKVSIVRCFLLLMHLFRYIILINSLHIPPPLPLLPLPSYSQLQWQQREIIMFFHFGVNTFTDSEWGTGKESPAVFNPTHLNPDQWFRVAAKAGISLAILTAKHHDGFCLWPSKYTDHSVAKSPWKEGHGDVVQEFVAAAAAHGVDAGLYLSPWDRHDRRYGKEKAYNEYYLAQLQELLTRYGSIREIWFDGAKGSNAPNMSYYFWDWFSMTLVQTPDGWEMKTDLLGKLLGLPSTGHHCQLAMQALLKCDVSIRPGWFWHKSEEPKRLSKLLEIYYKSVGRNCVLLLNVPPNSTGLISEIDNNRLIEFRNAINTIFSHNIAQKCVIQASSQRGGKGSSFGPENVLDNDHLWTYWAPSEENKQDQWIEIEAENEGLRFNVVMIQEAIGLGQRIQQHEVYVDGKRVANGSTVGYKRLHRLRVKEVNAKRVKIRVVKSRDLPLISSIGLFYDPYWHPNKS
ncbi:Alpha-L-fucosidase 1 [Bienertia sinuspersici]